MANGNDDSWDARATRDIGDYEKRMADEGRAEVEERNLARSMTGRDKSARADVWHRLMQTDSESAMDLRKRRSRSREIEAARKRSATKKRSD